VSTHHAVTTIPAGIVCAETTIVFASDAPALRGLLQSRPHELWAAFFGSSLKTDVRYGPSDCFDTYPLPVMIDDQRRLSDAAIAYHEYRSSLMISSNEGMTRTYNRFHDPAENGSDIEHLRQLHHALDIAVLHAYGWSDLADRAHPVFLSNEMDPDDHYQDRLFWPAPFRDEVLSRLLDLNNARAEEERRLGIPSRGHGGSVEEDEAA
jgi:hypothetical protein